MIHRQIPLATPCYDLVLVADLTLAPPVIGGTSGTTNSPDLTGGIEIVY